MNELRDAGILKHGDVVPRPGSNVSRASDETLLKIAKDPNADELIRVNRNADGTMTIIQGNQRVNELLNRAGQGRIGFGEDIPVWGRWGG
ncbi:hypothetical protein OHS18_12715 [Amycolatopsis sp. NBC_00355]|uniref:hypothetical protein n=1 Tax=Amycolatopsis sp. NBC_00355 TaxID=2975957 RepID=UPI002E264DE9